MKNKILVDGFIHKDAINKLKKKFDVYNSEEKNKQDLLKYINLVDAILLKTVNLNQEDLIRAKKIKIISRFGVGYDNLDTNFLKKNNITLAITSESNKITVAEHCFFMMMYLLKNGKENESLARRRIFDERKIMFGKNLRNLKILTMGYGRIAKELCKMCHAFGMKVFIYDPYKKIKNNKYSQISNYKKFLKFFDVISLHMICNDETEKMVDKKFFKMMKRGSVLLNTSRGKIINENDLIKLLKKNSKKIKFGLDVFEKEPPEKKNLILKSKDVFLTPHSATKTFECFRDMSLESADNIIDFFKKKIKKKNIVKF